MTAPRLDRRAFLQSVTAAGGALVAGGYLTSDQWTTIAGALAVIVGVVWSVIAKRAMQ